MKSRKFRVGLIGGGGIAQAVHIPGWKNLPEVEIVGVADVSEATPEVFFEAAADQEADAGGCVGRENGEVRLVRLKERVDEDRQRFESWHQRSLDQIAKQRIHYEVAYKGRIPRHLDESLQRRKRSIEDRKEQRGRWLSDTFTVIGTPYLKLAAVFVGE